jgi:antitoxin MazE
MQTKLIAIGNSRGIRIPKAAIDHYGFGDEPLELDMAPEGLLLRPSRNARRGWDKAFARMRKRGDDRMLQITSADLNQWDRKEWTW